MYANLKFEIFKRGLRQNHMARDLGLDETLLSKIIHGYREPTAAQRHSLALYLNVEENWLFEKFENVWRGPEAAPGDAPVGGSREGS